MGLYDAGNYFRILVVVLTCEDSSYLHGIMSGIWLADSSILADSNKLLIDKIILYYISKPTKEHTDRETNTPKTNIYK